MISTEGKEDAIDTCGNETNCKEEEENNPASYTCT
jgi:hypothetical protein